MTELRERVARAYWTVALRNGLANDLRQWDERNWDEGNGFKCHSPALDAKTKGRVMEAMDAAISAVMQDLEAPTSALETLQAENERLREALRKALTIIDNLYRVYNVDLTSADALDAQDSRAALGAKP